MDTFLADPQVNEGHHKNNAEKDQRRGAGAPLTVVAQGVVNEANHGVQPSAIVGRAHGLAKDAHNAGVFLEAADEARDHHIGQHGRDQRHGDAGKDPPAGRAVHPGRFVVLPVDGLQAAQQDQNLEGQGVPDDVDDHHHHIGGVGGAVVDPVDPGSAEELNDVVDDAGSHHDLVFRAVEAAHDVEHGGEHHADGDGVGHVGQEENGLQGLLQKFDGVQRHGDQQGQNGGDRHRPQAQEHRILQAGQKLAVLDDLDEVAKPELKAGAAGRFQTAVPFQQGHAHRVDDGPDGENQKQHNSRGKVQPRFPLIFAVDHITSPQTQAVFPSPCGKQRACGA